MHSGVKRPAQTTGTPRNSTRGADARCASRRRSATMDSSFPHHILPTKASSMRPKHLPEDMHRGSGSKRQRAGWTPTRLRIVAGAMGGRKIDYNGDPETRPMKERTREAVFSLLGGYLYGTFALDLFSGTGILGFEAISRGAERALLMELSRTTVSSILENAAKLQILDRVDVLNVDTLRWLQGDRPRRLPMDQPWVVFCCPPYRLWHEQTDAMCTALETLFNMAPADSQFICEADLQFDFRENLPALPWDVRKYAPAQVGVLRKPAQ
ncbi:MAG: hypothetical protein D6753_16395 [Planctomycetota bacterium]|nr:MAG: hypothetical protein D6753_16395 [Planctomycetota bacterium]